MRVGVFGAAGRMGVEVCRAVMADPDLELVAAVDPHHTGLDLRHVTGIDGVRGLVIERSAEALARAEAQVAVDFTQASAATANLTWCAEHGVHAVVGTTGFTEAEIDGLAELFGPGGKANCLITANFAIGAVLMMRFAELAAPFFESAEIIELHHGGKADAPSGTARATADRMARSSSDWDADPTTNLGLEGARGGVGPAGIHIHSVRLRGLVAHQEVVLGTAGQTLTIRHDSYDRSAFMPGVILAIKAIAGRPGLSLGLDDLLGL